MQRRAQSGITLVVSLIMLIVLTLLVVSAIRFGNINLKIAGNAQAEAEGSAAAQVAIEKMLIDIDAAARVDDITSRTVAVSTGGTSYSVTLATPSCIFARNMESTELDATEPDDQVCFGNADKGDRPLDANNKLTSVPTECKSQQWDITARVSDGASGASVTMLQGVGVRVSAETSCAGT